jgi:hypothetical protein
MKESNCLVRFSNMKNIKKVLFFFCDKVKKNQYRTKNSHSAAAALMLSRNGKRIKLDTGHLKGDISHKK